MRFVILHDDNHLVEAPRCVKLRTATADPMAKWSTMPASMVEGDEHLGAAKPDYAARLILAEHREPNIF
jgi:hypothetical protein